MPAPTPHPSSSNPTVQYQEQNQGDANEPPKKSAAKPMTSPAINANSVAATPGQKKRPSIFRWESMLGQTPRVNGMPAATPPAPISMRQLQYEPSMKNIYREMSINELKKIEPASADAFTEEFQQKAMDYGLLTVDEDSVSAPPAPPMPPIDGKSAPKAKSKAGPAPAEKIRQLQSQMSFRVPMLSPRTAVHFAALPPEYNEDLLNKMSTERTGEEMDSAQTILGLHAVIKGKGANYRFDSQKGLDPVPKPKKDVTVKVMKKEFEEVRVPHVKIEGTWIADMLDDDANLLGGSHKFEIDNVPVNLPVVDADEEIMAFFGCKLIRKGDVVTFPELRRPFPVFCLQIGQKYMEKYILERDLGGGVFLEYHDDNPHFHAPLSRRSGGYLLLGVPSEDRRGKPPLPKCPDETQKVTLKVAGVRVPYGCAVYTPPGVLHADSACTGRWLIGYDQSTDFSTVLFRNKEDEVVKMSEMRITM